MAGKGGGAWKVAYADFVTAMMAFFLVMWITAQSKPVKQAVAQYFSDPWGNSAEPSSQAGIVRREGSGSPPIIGPHKGGLGRGRGSTKPSPKAAGAADKGLQSGRPSLLVLQEKGHSHVGAVLQFGEHSAALDETATHHLEELVPMMLGKPNKIEIRGHASKRPLPKDSGFKDAWEISYARCLAAMNFLVSKGVAPDRIRLSQAGPYEPQSSELQADWPALDSRVDVYMLGEFVDDFVGTHDNRAQTKKAPAGKGH